MDLWLDAIPSAVVSVWAEALQHNTHLTKLTLIVTQFDLADVHAIQTALRLNTALTDVFFNLGGVRTDDRWWSPQVCFNECQSAGAWWKLFGKDHHCMYWDSKLSLRDVDHLAAALADPTVPPPLALFSSLPLGLLFFFFFLTI